MDLVPFYFCEFMILNTQEFGKMYWNEEIIPFLGRFGFYQNPAQQLF